MWDEPTTQAELEAEEAELYQSAIVNPTQTPRGIIFTGPAKQLAEPGLFSRVLNWFKAGD